MRSRMALRGELVRPQQLFCNRSGLKSCALPNRQLCQPELPGFSQLPLSNGQEGRPRRGCVGDITRHGQSQHAKNGHIAIFMPQQ